MLNLIVDSAIWKALGSLLFLAVIGAALYVVYDVPLVRK
ncbi:hypothetical protein PAESOLCIP111_01146 [Paenibacillus solanacearum]|uniref:Uncharacterized protein n=1 Tax=Paenibacillus solanacearum TaxID=2048548 RepID=A0A916JXU6_9BACL|nr:hypothetical protein PAESOLCIP111_01146 [Paenibacillus solanacearum]